MPELPHSIVAVASVIDCVCDATAVFFACAAVFACAAGWIGRKVVGRAAAVDVATTVDVAVAVVRLGMV